MDSIPKLNGKNWMSKGLLYVAVILALVVYIVVKDAGATRQTESLVNERLATLEECIKTLRPVPMEVSAMKATMDGVKSTVDKIEKKLDSHIERER